MRIVEFRRTLVAAVAKPCSQPVFKCFIGSQEQDYGDCANYRRQLPGISISSKNIEEPADSFYNLVGNSAQIMLIGCLGLRQVNR